MSEENTVALESSAQKVSYGFGLQFGQQLARNGFEGLDIEAAIAGLRTSYANQPSAVTEEDLNAAYGEIQEKMQKAAAEQSKKMAELGLRYLEENAKREGVLVTESGLQYEILEAGEGDKPSSTNTVRVHYHGTHINGEVFDSSVDRGEPAEFGVTQVIAGWTEILQMMPVGAKYRVTIPSELAYGEAGSPPVIPPSSVLVFEVHLIDIV